MLSIMERFKQYRPIKGTTDGKMANKVDVVWTPIASIMNKDNGGLLKEIAALGKGIKGRGNFDAATCKGKYRLW